MLFRSDVAVEYDSSVQGESRWQGVHWFPVEIKTRILDGLDDWEAIIPKTLDIARYLGGRITPSCGHHLHLSFEEIRQDARHVRSLWNLCHRFEPVLFGLVAPSRRNNHYCHAMPSTPKLLHGANSLQSLRRVLAAYDRYQGLNTTHLLGSSPRVELRYHQGTLDPVKARHWLRFCLQLIQHAVTRTCQAADAPVANDRQGMERLLVTIGLKVNSKVYATDRKSVV